MSKRRSHAPDDLANWSADRLIDHLVSTHHAYERAALIRLDHLFAEMVRLRGPDHQRLTEAATAFDRLKGYLERHLDKEEHILFPYIRELVAAVSYEPHHSPFGTIVNPIRLMEREHCELLESLQTVRSRVDAWAPMSAETASAECSEELRRLDEDVQRHVSVEDHVLFPKAIELETWEGRA
jgi:regulator of cell morphogenesis and NO signaling